MVQYLEIIFGKVTVKSLKDDLLKANYYSVLCDGSTDNDVTEQEAIQVLFLQDGTPKLRYFSTENVENATMVLSSINPAFERFGTMNFKESLLGLNCDGASVNMGASAGLGVNMGASAGLDALVKEITPWLELVHCFNHRIELVLKETFENFAFFKIENMLMKLHYLYQKSP